jgi:hypothetical protein
LIHIFTADQDLSLSKTTDAYNYEVVYGSVAGIIVIVVASILIMVILARKTKRKRTDEKSNIGLGNFTMILM